MQETLQAIEAVGRTVGGSAGGAALTILFLAAWAKRKGLLALFEKDRTDCPDPACKANMIHGADKQSALEKHVYEILSPKVNDIAEDVAFIRGMLE